MPKKQQLTLKKMEAKVETTVRYMSEALIAMFERALGKSVQIGNQSFSFRGGDKPEGTPKPEVDPLSEFRLSVRKVELPSFEGEDLAGWISRAEVYFRVQGTSPEIKVNLAQICMEGPTIHFFNSLFDENETMTWDIV
jgi:hypothetical protein